MEGSQPCPCKICDGPAEFLCVTLNEFSDTRHLHHYRCSRCGVVFVGDPLDAEELEQAYGRIDLYDPNVGFQVTEDVSRRKIGTILDNLKDVLSPQSHIIDIGTGHGQIIEILHQRGYPNLYVHEIPGADLSRIERFGPTVFQDFDYEGVPSDSFDVVTIIDVLEHVSDPRHLLHSGYRILKPGGTVYFHTPIVTKTDRIMHKLQKVPFLSKIGVLWQRGRTSIFHLQNFTPQSIVALLNECGFEKIGVEVKNELSWPINRYIYVYLLSRMRLPRFLSYAFNPLFYPLFATRFFNANKAVVRAQKPL